MQDQRKLDGTLMVFMIEVFIFMSCVILSNIIFHPLVGAVKAISLGVLCISGVWAIFLCGRMISKIDRELKRGQNNACHSIRKS